MQITRGKDDKGLKLYDPGYLNTAPVRSSISYIDGDEGILRYRGYPIEELAESSSFLEVAYLISKSFIIIMLLLSACCLWDKPTFDHGMSCFFVYLVSLWESAFSKAAS